MLALPSLGTAAGKAWLLEGGSEASLHLLTAQPAMCAEKRPCFSDGHPSTAQSRCLGQGEQLDSQQSPSCQAIC